MATNKAKFNVSDVVISAPSFSKQPKHGRNDHVGGNAAYHMSINILYVVTEVTQNGGLRLKGFTLVVSQSDVVLA